jgi:hypothetical protein
MTVPTIGAAAPLLPVQYPSHVMRTTLTKLTEKRKTKWTMSQTYPIWRLAHLTLKKRSRCSKVARKEDDEELRKELELKTERGYEDEVDQMAAKRRR